MSEKKMKALRREARKPIYQQIVRAYKDGTEFKVPVGLRTSRYVYKILKKGYREGKVEV